MDFSENTLPKMNLSLGGGFSLLSADAGIARTLENSAGKVLLLSDRDHYAKVAPFSAHPRAITVILEGDCLPLFAMPDGVSRAVAVGERDVLQAARFFAEVRNIPCELFPADAALDGAFEAEAPLTVNGEKMTFPLASAEVYGDLELMQPTLKRACVRLLLARLALFEERALHLLCGRQTAGEESEQAYAVCGSLKKPTAAQIVIKNALLRQCERAGAPVGEGVALSALLFRAGIGEAEWTAFAQLTALYAAFFDKGKPRRYLVPRYSACAEIATSEQYCARAMALERFRTTLLKELDVLTADGERCRRALSLPKDCGENLSELKKLSQSGRGGLTALMHDFGLMEWDL